MLEATKKTIRENVRRETEILQELEKIYNSNLLISASMKGSELEEFFKSEPELMELGVVGNKILKKLT